MCFANWVEAICKNQLLFPGPDWPQLEVWSDRTSGSCDPVNFFQRVCFSSFGFQSDRHVLAGLTGPPGQMTRSAFSREGVFLEILFVLLAGLTGLARTDWPLVGSQFGHGTTASFIAVGAWQVWPAIGWRSNRASLIFSKFSSQRLVFVCGL